MTNKANPQQADLDAVWAAGFFDGEGSFAAYTYIRNGRVHQRHFKASIPQSNKGILIWFACTFGGTWHVKDAGKKNSLTKKDHWEWHVSGQDTYAFIQRILPFLKVKQEHASFMLTIWDNRYDRLEFDQLVAERKRRWGRAAAETK